MQNIIESFFENCNKTPDKIFCVDSNGSISYIQAQRIILSVAKFIKEQNIQNQPIILKADRNNKTLLAILAICLSNNHYVPINPTYAQEKIDSILETSCAKYEIRFDENKINGLTSFLFDDITNFDCDISILECFKKDFCLDNNIYTIYTSGSTGQPKGVLKTQKNIISFVNNFVETFNFDEELKIANQAPLFFDASMKDVFLTIKLGATIFFPEKSLFAFPMKLVEYLNQNQINYICWVPSALTIIVRLNTFKYIKPEYLKYVFFVGEVFLPKYLNIWLKELPTIMYTNLYGSTELAGVCLYKIIDKELDDSKPIPLGKPLKNNNVFLVDGEIVIDSDQIAKGYINDPVKNSQVFTIKDCKKYLNSGDFAFVDENNDIVFLSRKDFQIKHMGYRIELQEIDIAVSALKYIDNCAVLFDEVKDKIVAFVSLNTDLENPTKIILTDLKAKLPDYMVPNKITILEELPLNANGKIDRTKLKQTLGE